jgi:hypothetical protein
VSLATNIGMLVGGCIAQDSSPFWIVNSQGIQILMSPDIVNLLDETPARLREA